MRRSQVMKVLYANIGALPYYIYKDKKKQPYESFRVKRWGKNPTPHVVHKSCGNGNRIAYPSIKVEERKCSTKNAHFLSFFIYIFDNQKKIRTLFTSFRDVKRLEIPPIIANFTRKNKNSNG